MADAVAVAPNHYSVIEDNDKVRILSFEGAVGTKTEMHSHPNIVAIVLSDSAVRFTSPDGRSMEFAAQGRHGDVHGRRGACHRGHWEFCVPCRPRRAQVVVVDVFGAGPTRRAGDLPRPGGGLSPR